MAKKDAEDTYDFADEPAQPKPKPAAARPPVAGPPRPVSRGATRAGSAEDEAKAAAKKRNRIIGMIAGGLAGLAALTVIEIRANHAREIAETTPQSVESAAPASPARPAPSASSFSAESAWTTIAGGARMTHLDATNAAGLQTHLIVYLPKSASATSRVPCVFIAPAGSRLFHGMTLTDGDAPEHLPYVAAGFAVVAYSIGGPLEDRAIDNNDVAAIRQAFDTFRKSEGGVADAEIAIAYAHAKRPEINSSNLFVAGHSSAATLALLVAIHDDRIKGCCAYAPAVDVVERNRAHLADLESVMPGYTKLANDISAAHLPKPKGRVFLFSAEDDDNVPTSDVRSYAAFLGPIATMKTVPSGGHYDSMLAQGIPAGIEFMKSLVAGSKANGH